MFDLISRVNEGLPVVFRYTIRSPYRRMEFLGALPELYGGQLCSVPSSAPHKEFMIALDSCAIVLAREKLARKLIG